MQLNVFVASQWIQHLDIMLNIVYILYHSLFVLLYLVHSRPLPVSCIGHTRMGQMCI